MYQHKPTLREERLAAREIIKSTTWRILLIALVVVLSVLYVFTTTATSTRGFVMNELEQKITQLEQENQQLQVQIAEQRSLGRIQEKLKETTLVKTTSVEYISSLGATVARR